MSAVGSTPADGAVDGIEGVDAIMRRGGESLRRRMVRAELHLENVTAQAGAPLASPASATIRAGGKRLRPLLVVLASESAGGPPETQDGEERLLRAAVAVELVHSATLVHDDLIDGAQLRRGHPTVAAVAGRAVAVATGDLLFSLAFAELARNESATQLRALSDASSALAAGELLQREDAYAAHVAVERYLRRCELKTAALFEAACRLGALTAAAGLGRAGRRAGRVRAAHRPGLSDARRRARRVRPGRAHGQVARHRPARRHGHAAADPRARARLRSLTQFDLASLSGPEQAEELCERIAATGALHEARERALAVVAEAKAALPSILPDGRAALLGPRRRRGRGALPLVSRNARSEVRRHDQIRVERAHEEVDFLGHVRVRHAAQIAEQRAGGAVELVVEQFDGRLLEHALAP